MTKSILILAALALPLVTAGCPHGEDHDDESHGHDHDSEGGHDHDADHEATETTPQAPAPGIVTSVKDPSCGEAVTTDTAHVLERDGTRHYFCSAACQEKFEAAPAPEADPKTEGGDDHGHDHGDDDHDH